MSWSFLFHPEESDEEEESSFSSVLGLRANRSFGGHSPLVLSLTVDRGHVTMVTPTNVGDAV